MNIRELELSKEISGRARLREIIYERFNGVIRRTQIDEIIDIIKGESMILTNTQINEFAEAAKPLVKWLCENCHPHVYVIVEPNRAELVEGISSVKIEEFIKD